MIAAIVIIIVALLYVGVGAVIHYASRPVTAPPSARPECQDCANLDAWWNSLDGAGKFFSAGWYGVVKLSCLARGC